MDTLQKLQDKALSTLKKINPDNISAICTWTTFNSFYRPPTDNLFSKGRHFVGVCDKQSYSLIKQKIDEINKYLSNNKISGSYEISSEDKINIDKMYFELEEIIKNTVKKIFSTNDEFKLWNYAKIAARSAGTSVVDLVSKNPQIIDLNSNILKYEFRLDNKINIPATPINSTGVFNTSQDNHTYFLYWKFSYKFRILFLSLLNIVLILGTAQMFRMNSIFMIIPVILLTPSLIGLVYVVLNHGTHQIKIDPYLITYMRPSMLLKQNKILINQIEAKYVLFDRFAIIGENQLIRPKVKSSKSEMIDKFFNDHIITK